MDSYILYGTKNMCEKTVGGVDLGIRTIGGTDAVGERTVPGTDTFNDRNVSGVQDGALPIVLLGTTPTFTELTPGSISPYIAPAGCVYIQVYAVGGAGDGKEKGSLAARHGSGGGAGGVSMNFLKSGTYPFSFNGFQGTFNSGANRIRGLNGSSGSVPTSTTTTYRGGAPGTTENSVHTFGYKSARSPGELSADGGASFVFGVNGQGYFAYANTDINAGIGGQKTAGGGGATMNTSPGSGGSGANPYILIIEYY